MEREPQQIKLFELKGFLITHFQFKDEGGVVTFVLTIHAKKPPRLTDIERYDLLEEPHILNVLTQKGWMYADEKGEVISTDHFHLERSLEIAEGDTWKLTLVVERTNEAGEPLN